MSTLKEVMEAPTGMPDELGPSSRTLLTQRTREAELRAKVAEKERQALETRTRALELEHVAQSTASQRVQENYRKLFVHYQSSQTDLKALKQAHMKSLEARQVLDRELREMAGSFRELKKSNAELKEALEKELARRQAAESRTSLPETIRARFERELEQLKAENNALEEQIREQDTELRKREANARIHEDEFKSRQKLETEKLVQRFVLEAKALEHRLETERSATEARIREAARMLETVDQARMIAEAAAAEARNEANELRNRAPTETMDPVEVERYKKQLAVEVETLRTIHPLRDYLAFTEREIQFITEALPMLAHDSQEYKARVKSLEALRGQRSFLKDVLREAEDRIDQQLVRLTRSRTPSGS